MKIAVILMVLIMPGASVLSQDEERPLPNTASVCILAKPSGVNGGLTAFTGFRVGYIGSGKYYAGATIQGMPMDNIQAGFRDESGGNPVLKLIYFGVTGEYFFNHEDTYVFSLQADINRGYLLFENESPVENGDQNTKITYERIWHYSLEPAVNVTFGQHPWLRVYAGAGYRFILGLEYENGGIVYDSAKLNGPFIQIGLMFGEM